MILEEFLINWLAPPEAFFGSVPEADLVFAELPAQAYIAVPIARHKVEQADIEILDQRPCLFDFLEGLFQRRYAGIPAGPERENVVRVDPRAARHPHPFGGSIHIPLCFLRLGFVESGVAEVTLHLWQGALRLGQREITHAL